MGSVRFRVNPRRHRSPRVNYLGRVTGPTHWIATHFPPEIPTFGRDTADPGNRRRRTMNRKLVRIATAGAVLAAGLTGTAAYAGGGGHAAKKPTVVLVHGAFADST